MIRARHYAGTSFFDSMLAAYYASIMSVCIMLVTSPHSTPLIIIAFASGAAVGIIGRRRTSPCAVDWCVLQIFSAYPSRLVSYTAYSIRTSTPHVCG